MNIYQLLKASFMEPKKQAAVRILSIGKIMRFVFLFILLLTIVAFVEFVIGLNSVSGDLEGLLVYIEEIEWLLYPLAFVLLFVSTTLYHFIKISLFAWIGMGILKIMKRRGEYRHLWRTAALSVTFPTILSFGIGFLVENEWLPLMLSLLTLVYLYMAIKYYPKKPPQRN
ncbi:4-hydroxy-3-methylbut-2-en-1-yl diphosphate synthase [Planococcus halotolerans]|uniref:4-hydroxy-3-methylbut-2-en-1-yl diphosphate synthase n=1 Tax=Planococcus halotolerans TaxID=2233542 RepID=A0A365KU07_9BACL|nr:DUF1189 domain-containing protein [Planococcus halotolerans]RAZ76659.1 4-hydroxy-3-methylbut-2-en-1-yl diphosphate synthase [Planococcus halotolerans]